MHTASSIQEYLHRHIPLSAAMEVRVLDASQERVALEVPLAPNLNHRGTGFGGSISALAILSAWTLIHVRLTSRGIHGRIVIQRNAIEYLAPAEEAMTAECPAPEIDAWLGFEEMIRRRGRGRITLQATVRSGPDVVARLEGTYVAFDSGHP